MSKLKIKKLAAGNFRQVFNFDFFICTLNLP